MQQRLAILDISFPRDYGPERERVNLAGPIWAIFACVRNADTQFLRVIRLAKMAP
jgi:hypothetical protein